MANFQARKPFWDQRNRVKSPVEWDYLCWFGIKWTSFEPAIFISNDRINQTIFDAVFMRLCLSNIGIPPMKVISSTHYIAAIQGIGVHQGMQLQPSYSAVCSNIWWFLVKLVDDIHWGRIVAHFPSVQSIITSLWLIESLDPRESIHPPSNKSAQMKCMQDWTNSLTRWWPALWQWSRAARKLQQKRLTRPITWCAILWNTIVFAVFHPQ